MLQEVIRGEHDQQALARRVPGGKPCPASIVGSRPARSGFSGEMPERHGPRVSTCVAAVLRHGLEQVGGLEAHWLHISFS